MVNSTWRKRMACQRCHNLKVRCEYASPTSFVCTRCEKSGTECVLPSKARKTDNQEMESPVDSEERTCNNVVDEAVYLGKIIAEAERKLAKLNVTPLQRACHTGATTREVAQLSYDMYKEGECIAPFLSTLQLPDSITDLDQRMPRLAYSMMMVRHLHSKKMDHNQLLEFYNTVAKIDSYVEMKPEAAIDNVLAYSMICRYALPPNELGIELLLNFYSKTVGAIQKFTRVGNRFMSEYCKWTSLLTIMPYTMIEQFSNLRYMYQFYRENILTDSTSFCEKLGSAVIKNDGLVTMSSAQPLLQLLDAGYAGIQDLKNAPHFEAINYTISNVFKDVQKLENCLVIFKNEIMKIDKKCRDFDSEMLTFPIWTCDMMSRIKLVKVAVIRILELMYAVKTDNTIMDAEQQLYNGRQLLERILTQLSDMCSSVIRAFSEFGDHNPLVPTWSFYVVPECLKLLHMARIASFAGQTGNNIRANCMLEVASVKWNELASNSILAKRLYLNLFQAQSLLFTKIGVINQFGEVDGPGSMPEFFIIYDHGKAGASEQVAMTHDQLLSIIVSQSRENYAAKPSSEACHLNGLNIEHIIKEHWNVVD